jgi:hypothetical protein
MRPQGTSQGAVFTHPQNHPHCSSLQCGGHEMLLTFIALCTHTSKAFVTITRVMRCHVWLGVPVVVHLHWHVTSARDGICCLQVLLGGFGLRCVVDVHYIRWRVSSTAVHPPATVQHPLGTPIRVAAYEVPRCHQQLACWARRDEVPEVLLRSVLFGGIN